MHVKSLELTKPADLVWKLISLETIQG
jgi:hypothetical protein